MFLLSSNFPIKAAGKIVSFSLSLSFLLAACSMTPFKQQQQNTFNPIVSSMPTPVRPVGKTEDTSVLFPSSSSSKPNAALTSVKLEHIEDNLRNLQENIQTQQNGLIDLAGKIDKIVGVEVDGDISALKAAISAQAQVLTSLTLEINTKFDIQSKVVAELTAELNTDLSLIKANITKIMSMQNDVVTTAGRDANSSVKTTYNSVIGYIVICLALIGLFGFQMWFFYKQKNYNEELNVIKSSMTVLPLNKE